MQTTEAKTLYAGADLHGNNVFLSLIDGGGKEVYRRRVKANLAVFPWPASPRPATKIE
ncbi:MAG: hypothetical protein AB7V14_09065 [Kiritimatiellia bacterium]